MKVLRPRLALQVINTVCKLDELLSHVSGSTVSTYRRRAVSSMVDADTMICSSIRITVLGGCPIQARFYLLIVRHGIPDVSRSPRLGPHTDGVETMLARARAQPLAPPLPKQHASVLDLAPMLGI